MDYNIQSITNYWDEIDVTGATVRSFGPVDRAFSGRVQIATPSESPCSVLIVNGYAVQTSESLPKSDVSVIGAKEAQDPSLPFLVAVEGRSTERLRRYTRDLSLEKVVDKLTGTGFTGYVELVENVVSGDYYVTFHAGRPRYVAIHSEERPPVIGEEAKEEMFKEVGIYSVYRCYVNPVNLSMHPAQWDNPKISTEPFEYDSSTGSGDTKVFSTDDTGSDSSGDTKVFSSMNPGSDPSGQTEVFEQRDDDLSDQAEVYNPKSDPSTTTKEHDGRYCTLCGKGVDKDANFCPLCGTELDP